MNKARRKELETVISNLNEIQGKDDLYACINDLEKIRDDEQDYYDNIPENLQYSQRAEDSEAAIDNLEEALDLINEAYDADTLDMNDNFVQEAIATTKIWQIKGSIKNTLNYCHRRKLYAAVTEI